MTVRTRTALSLMAAAGLSLGALVLGPSAQAAETSPLLAGTAGATALNEDQMKDVQGSGYWANYYGSRGLQYLSYAKSYGEYARYTAPANSTSEYTYYGYAASAASSAASYFSTARTYSYYGY